MISPGQDPNTGQLLNDPMAPALNSIDAVSQQYLVNDVSSDDLFKEGHAQQTYGFTESFYAGINILSPINAIGRLIENTNFIDDVTYDPMEDEQIPEGYEWRFINSASAQETSVRLERLIQDTKDMEALQWGNPLAVVQHLLLLCMHLKNY